MAVMRMTPILMLLDAAVSSGPGARAAQIYDDPRSSVSYEAANDRSDDKEDFVITPEGPRPRDKVHHVKPGEGVRQNEDGTYTIAPEPAPPGPDQAGEKRKAD